MLALLLRRNLMYRRTVTVQADLQESVTELFRLMRRKLVIVRESADVSNWVR